MPSVELIHGDCLEVMKDIEDGSVDLIITSPPYNMRTRVKNGKYTTREQGAHFSRKYDNFDDGLSIEDFRNFHSKVLHEALRVSNMIFYNIQIVTGSKEAFFKIIGEFALNIKDIIVWDKGHGQPSMHSGCINRASELILILESNASAGRVLKNYNFNRGELSDIWRIKRERSLIKGHGAVFPLKLAEKALLSFSKENNFILDPFMGTGTVGVSCKKLKRNFIGIELDKEYFNNAKKRINNSQPQVQLFNENI